MEHDLTIIKKGDTPVVDSVVLYRELQVSSHHIDWIRRRIENYNFQEGSDFYKVKTSSLPVEVRGKRRGEYSYLLALDTAKEISMLENNEVGRSVRRYFIRRDKELRKIETFRLAGIEARKTLTEAIQDSGENDRMHGYGYSNFTRLAYKLTGIDVGTRDALGEEDLGRLEAVETIIRGLIKAGKQYGEIKASLLPIFQV